MTSSVVGLLVCGHNAALISPAALVRMASAQIWPLHSARSFFVVFGNAAVLGLAVLFTVCSAQIWRTRTWLRRELLRITHVVETYLSFTRFRLLFHPIISMKECRIFASPGFLNFQGGVFNPGAILHDGKIIVCAKGQEMHWSDAIGSKQFEFYMRGKPILMELDRDLSIRDAREVPEVRNLREKEDFGIEDFRMFQFNGKKYINHSMCYKEAEGGYSRAKQCLSALDVEKKEITYLGEPDLDFEVSAMEKNWGYFEHGSELYLLFSISPYVLLKASRWPDLSFETVIKREIDTRAFQEEVFPTFLSISTNPIDYDSDHLLVLVHKFVIIGHRIYAHWAVLIDKKSLVPVKVSSRPIFCGGKARGMLPGIVYTTAVLDWGDSLIIFNGESDLQCSYSKFAKKRLDACWVDLALGGKS
jgi:predicted GH43/DUF377 family glycosyl hydrolase